MAIDPELQGLLHVSELTDKRGAVVKDLIETGDTLEVKIIGIDRDKKKISLSALAVVRDEADKEARDYMDNEQADRGATIGDAVEEN